MILRIEKAKITGHYTMWLQFNDGVAKQVNLYTLLDGPIFEPLLDLAFFAQMQLDPVAGTIVWPNGADFAPEALYELPSEPNWTESQQVILITAA